MLGILFPFACLFGTALYFIFAAALKVPTLATTKAVIAVTRRERKQARIQAVGAKGASTAEAIFFFLAVAVFFKEYNV